MRKAKRKVEVPGLYEGPFTSFGLNAVNKLFGANEIEEIVALVKKPGALI